MEQEMEKGFRRPSGHVAALLCLRGCAPWAAEVARAPCGRKRGHVIDSVYPLLPASRESYFKDE